MANEQKSWLDIAIPPTRIIHLNPNTKGGDMFARIQSVAAGSFDDPAVNSLIEFAKNGFGDTQMFGLLARRSDLLKRVASVFAYFLAGEGGLIEPRLLELMRVRGAHLNACTYCATVRLQPVAEEVKAKEAALGVCDISGMTKSQAVAALRDKLAKSEFTPREAAALSLVDRIIVDPHSVDDALFAELRNHFSDEEIIELVCEQSLYLGRNAEHRGSSLY
jgi:alkylhydroperoxidase family enzyme